MDSGLELQPLDVPEAKQDDSLNLQEDHEDDHQDLSPRTHQRALDLMRKATFFHDKRDELIEELAHWSKFATEPEGTVLFRQGDPPGNLYLPVSGDVGIFVGGDKSSPRKPVTKGCERLKVPQAAWDLESRVCTVEGFSTWCNASKFGRRVAKAPRGQIFGEKGLEDGDAIRHASARCMAESELLVLHFDHLAKAQDRIKRKRNFKFEFLRRHVPGMREEPLPDWDTASGQSHFINCFQRETTFSDHTFLRQGTVEPQRIVYVLLSGTVQITRKKSEKSEVCDELYRGAVFGSLPHVDVPEPFTAMAVTACEFFQLELNKEMQEAMPEAILDAISRHISAKTSQVLKKSCVDRHFGWDAQRRHCAKLRPASANPAKNPKLSPWILY